MKPIKAIYVDDEAPALDLIRKYCETIDDIELLACFQNPTEAVIYERMDENKDSYYKEFVTKSVYEAEARLRKENMDGRFERIVELFNEKIESLRNEIRGLINNGKH